LDGDQQVRASVTNEIEVTMNTQASDGKSSTSNIAPDANPIQIAVQDTMKSVAFLADGEHVMSAGLQGNVRRWRVADGKEVGKSMARVGSPIRGLAVSQDDKWIVCGTWSGQVIVLDAKSHKKVTQFAAHRNYVRAVDISADGTKIATGSHDKTLSIWSFPDGKRLLGPFKHDDYVVAVKFSPDGRHIATATACNSIRVYDSSDGLLAEFPIWVIMNGSLAWASDSNRLFVLSYYGNVHCFDVSIKTTLAKWRIHSDDKPRCIALACNGTVIAASANSSVSFWDTKTHEQIGTVIHRSHDISCMTISPSYDIATAGGENITLGNLYDILPSPYRDIVSNFCPV
jgi:WD40 repeat protein